jgi:hypothetical protein
LGFVHFVCFTSNWTQPVVLFGIGHGALMLLGAPGLVLLRSPCLHILMYGCA